jgi:RNA polymerase sigma factor (sigma-70 family)
MHGEILRQFRTLFDVGTVQGLSDGQLLDRYLTRDTEGAELAFAALVERHGPMVSRVCRRVLADAHDTQDAVQATFLILARRAPAIRRRESVAIWLHGVALRVARCARKASARRRAVEQRAAERAAERASSTVSELDDDVRGILDEELDRLPARLREPIVLCYLEGSSCEEAAQKLGWPLGTVKSRLSRGRERLRGRLTRRGLAPSAGALLAAEAALPRSLTTGTVRLALMAGGMVPPHVRALMEGGLTMMAMAQIVRVATVGLALAAGAAGVVAIARPPVSGPAPQHAREGAKVAMQPYVVEPPDLIEIEVVEALPDRPIKGDHLVRPDGTISLGYYGQVYVSGLTPLEIKAKVGKHLRKYLTDEQLGLSAPNPERPGYPKSVAAEDSTRIKVEVTAFNSKVYYVLGGVVSPGRMPVTGNETVLDAINYAGGLLPDASSADIRLVRPAPPGASREQVLPVQYDRITQLGDPTTNYQLMPGDRLIVAHDPAKAGVDREATQGATGNDEISALKRRVSMLEQKLDRILEFLGGEKALDPSNPPRKF